MVPTEDGGADRFGHGEDKEVSMDVEMTKAVVLDGVSCGGLGKRDDVSLGACSEVPWGFK